MVKDDLVITVPSFFKCPISLDVMKSPVSLCTGVTYDRASIQKWLDNGNNTCPATMQALPSKDFTPNLTLQRLIATWHTSCSASARHNLLSPNRAHHLLHSLHPSSSSNVPNLKTAITHIADSLQTPHSDSRIKNRDFLVNAGCVHALLKLISQVNCLTVDVAEAAIRVLRLVLPEPGSGNADPNLRFDWGSLDPNPQGVLLVLQKGSIDSRIDAAKVLESLISIRGEILSLVLERENGYLTELFRLTSDGCGSGSEFDKRAVEAGLSGLIAAAATRRRVRPLIVRLGIIPVLGKILSRPDSGRNVVAEKAVEMLEMAATCAEGREAICGDPECIPAVVRSLLKGSRSATERAVGVLWSVCHLFRDRKAHEVVAESNGLTKILLVMQSGCSPAVRHMCSDLVKIFRVNSKSCLSRYDTKTIHIMPF